MPRLELWHKVLILIGLAFATYFFLDGKWEESSEVVAAKTQISQEVSEIRFCAYSNKEMYLKMKLDDLCKKYYGRQYPCLPNRMNNGDRADFLQWEGWYKQQVDQTKKAFGGKG
jgi:hypothetical protein